MITIFEISFYISIILIFWAMFGYPSFILLVSKLKKQKPQILDHKIEPFVSIIIPAYNEEKVIKTKLDNLMNIDYPSKKIEIIIASDNSVDKTNEIVKDYIATNPAYKISLYVTKKRMGKTNAQNEAVDLCKGDILVFSDANSHLDKNAVRELVSYFIDSKTVYVCGRLKYINGPINEVANLESTYWDMEIRLRLIESELQTITTGNGALYSVRKENYIKIEPIKSHDSEFPYLFAKQGYMAKFNPNAIAYEKAGESYYDEFRRKIRMRRKGFTNSIPHLKVLNFVKYRWYSIFYLSHRYLRDILWLLHLVAFVTNLVLSFNNYFFLILLVLHSMFYLLAFIKQLVKIKLWGIDFIYYYCLTLLAQYIGVIREVSGKSKPFWEKADSTR